MTLACVSLVSCNDFLDRQPGSEVGPENYLNTESDLASYPIAYYPFIFNSHGGWSTGIGRYDDHTDNQATSDASLARFEVGKRTVPADGNLGMSTIRGCNYFLNNVLPKWKSKSISGNPENIKHYIGEVYMLRAMAYYDKLQTYGDFPIILTPLPDKDEVLVENGKRAPRNIVARQIISDLDSAALLMKTNAFNRTRLTRDAALIAKSRVALFEATFLTYHRDTPRVPGGPNWPGAKMAYNKDFKIDLDNEINWFLDQSMVASKDVAERVRLTENSGKFNPEGGKFSGWNPYFEMFGARDMGQYPEIIFWRQYNSDLSVAHGVSIYIRRGGNTGLTRSMMESFIMKNGYPIYDARSGYKGDVKISDTKIGRDDRLNLFVLGEGDPVDLNKSNGSFVVPYIINLNETRDVTGYRSRKFLNYDPSEGPGSDLTCQAGAPVYRAVEAYLNYIEASYLKNKTIDATADKYWKNIRKRAGVDEDYRKTINATDMQKETADWGAYSAGKLLTDATLYNIRRERRDEFVSEGMRWEDVLRWRSLDQVKNYIVEGFNLWDEAYKNELYVNPKPGETGGGTLLADGSAKANVSAKSLSKYLRPYQIVNVATNKIGRAHV